MCVTLTTEVLFTDVVFSYKCKLPRRRRLRKMLWLLGLRPLTMAMRTKASDLSTLQDLNFKTDSGLSFRQIVTCAQGGIATTDHCQKITN